MRVRFLLVLAALGSGAFGAAACGADAPSPFADGGLATDGGLGNGWSSRASLPTERQEIVAAAVDGAVYVIGGLDSAARGLTSVLRYRPAEDRWESRAPYSFAVDHAAIAVWNGRIFVMGGSENFQPSVPLTTVYSYDTTRNLWDKKADQPLARWGAGAATVGDRIYVGGGLGPNPNRILVYEPAADRWEILAGVSLSPRDHLAVGAVGGKVYFMGGRNTQNVDLVEELDPTGPTVTTRTPMPTARGGMAGAVIGDAIYVPGGENLLAPRGSGDDVYPQLEVYHPVEDRWTTAPPMPTPRHGLGVTSLDGVLYTIGGGTIAGLRASAVVQAFTP